MGVSLFWTTHKSNKEHPLTVGWRSMMYQMLLDNGLLGSLSDRHIPTLEDVAARQMKGVNDPPFDHADDIAEAFQQIIKAIKKHGSINVQGEW